MNAALSVTDNLNEESEGEVALLVVVLDTISIKSVVLDTGEFPRSVLEASELELLEEGSDLSANVVSLNVCVGGAGLSFSELD